METKRPHDAMSASTPADMALGTCAAALPFLYWFSFKLLQPSVSLSISLFSASQIAMSPEFSCSGGIIAAPAPSAGVRARLAARSLRARASCEPSAPSAAAASTRGRLVAAAALAARRSAAAARLAASYSSTHGSPTSHSHSQGGAHGGSHSTCAEPRGDGAEGRAAHGAVWTVAVQWRASPPGRRASQQPHSRCAPRRAPWRSPPSAFDAA